MTEMIGLFFGVVFSLVVVSFAHTKSPAGERRIYALGLVVAALIYVVFALAGGANLEWHLLEIFGVLLYGVTALAGLRWRSWVLALGWSVHIAWDVLFHLHGDGAEFTPQWYPWLCLSFDLVVAGAALMSEKRNPAHLTATEKN